MRPAPAACRRDPRTCTACVRGKTVVGAFAPRGMLRVHRLYYRKRWPCNARSSPGARCSTRRARTDGSCARRAKDPATTAKLVDPPEELHPEVLAALSRLEIERLYSHQAEAIYSSWEGPTIVTTGTASGKSLCFNLPTLDVLCRDTKARALYLYPTKALAQDQARALAAFGLTKRVRPAIYDGDTPREARADIRRRANVVLTNPDMLHVGILPNHPAWTELFANLAVVVVDEAHVYRGVFGSHVANVLRRLRRIAAAYGTAPALPAHLGHDRQPGRAGRAPDGLGGREPDRRGRLAGAGTADRGLEPTADRRGSGQAPLGARGGGRAARAASARRGASDLLHEVAQGRRGPTQAARRGLGGGRRSRACKARGPLPRRLHLPAAPRAWRVVWFAASCAR